MTLLKQILKDVEEALSSLYIFQTIFILREYNYGGHYLTMKFFVRTDMPLAGMQEKGAKEYRANLIKESIRKFRALRTRFQEELADLSHLSKDQLEEQFVEGQEALLVTSLDGFVTKVDLLMRDSFDEAICPWDVSGSNFTGNHIVFHLDFLIDEDQIGKLREVIGKLRINQLDRHEVEQRTQEVWITKKPIERVH